jgi:hypothetical protein
MEHFSDIYIDSINSIENWVQKEVQNYPNNYKNSLPILILRKGYDKEELLIFNHYLKLNKNITINICIGNNIENDKKLIYGSQVLNYLTSVQKLNIFVDYNVLQEKNIFEDLKHIIDLKELRITGTINKNVSLEPILKFKMDSFCIDLGLNKNQQKIIDSLENLKYLNVKSLDLSTFSIKSKLNSLLVDSSLKNHSKTNELFPNLKLFQLGKNNHIADFSFINDLTNLEELRIFQNKNLEKFPKLNNLKEIKKIELLYAGHLKNIDEILNFENLEKLAITRIKHLEAKDFERFSVLKKLNTLYGDFNDGKQQTIFNEIAKKNNWVNSHLYW